MHQSYFGKILAGLTEDRGGIVIREAARDVNKSGQHTSWLAYSCPLRDLISTHC